MTLDERISVIKTMLGDDVDEDDNVLTIYLNQAKAKILNHRYPFGTTLIDVEAQYESDLLELAVVLYNKRGVEGEDTHSENNVNSKYRSVEQILKSIPRKVGLPK